MKKLLLLLLLEILVISSCEKKDVTPWGDDGISQVELRLQKTQFGGDGGETHFILITNPQLNKEIDIRVDKDANWYDTQTTNVDTNKGLEFRRVSLKVYKNQTGEDRWADIMIFDRISGNLISSFGIFQSK